MNLQRKFKYMKIFRKIRDLKKLNSNQMAGKLDITLPGYRYLEDRAAATKLELLVKLQEISGFSDGKFWGAIKATVRK